MTFTPQVLTQTDNNNSTSGFFLNFPGSPTITTGFNTLILTIQSNVDSSAGGIQIKFSDDGITNWITPYIDTYFSPNIYTKNYLIIKKYYKVIYDSSSNLYQTTITSRLSTDLDSSITQNTSITVFDNNVENTLDAFGKLRVSNPTTLLDIRFPGQSSGDSSFLNNNLQICSASSGGTYTGAYSNSKLVITASGAGYYISQSRNYCTYQPGKSLLFMGSGVLYPGNDAYTTRIGYFDNIVPLSNNLTVQNGLYFQHSGGNYSVHVDSNGGSIFSITQNNWNIDKMNGSGPSGLTLDFTKTQLFLIDMEWLGVGRIRFGFYAYGRIQYCHQITNINILIQPYTFSINLPICYTIHNSGSGPAVNKFTQICSTVISEGGYSPLGRPFTASTQTTSITLSGETPILFLRGGSSNYYHQNIIPKGLSIIADSTSNNNALYYRLRLYLAPNSPASSIVWNDVNTTYSVCQYATGAPGQYTGFTSANSIIIDENYFFGKGENLLSGLENVFSTQVLQLTSNISNTADILVLTCYKTGGTSSVYANLSWQELY